MNDYTAYQERRISHWDAIAGLPAKARSWAAYYHARLIEVYRQNIPPGLRILELGCGKGDLLASLSPSLGVGLDFSYTMVAAAKARHPGMVFVQADTHALPFSKEKPFDVVILSDLLNDVWDIEAVFKVDRKSVV